MAEKDKYKELGATLTRTNIVVEWEELDSKIQMSAENRMALEAEKNIICKILGVGADVKDIKPGQFGLMGGAGRLITLNGVTYGIVKEHMIDAAFDTAPVVTIDHGESQGDIVTSATEAQIDRFASKHRFNPEVG